MPSAPYRQAKSRCGIDAARLDTPFLEERDLPAQNQVLRGYGLAWLEKEGCEPTRVGQRPEKQSHQQDHEIIMPQAVSLSRVARASNICAPQRFKLGSRLASLAPQI